MAKKILTYDGGKLVTSQSSITETVGYIRILFSSHMGQDNMFFNKLGSKKSLTKNHQYEQNL